MELSIDINKDDLDNLIKLIKAYDNKDKITFKYLDIYHNIISKCKIINSSSNFSISYEDKQTNLSVDNIIKESGFICYNNSDIYKFDYDRRIYEINYYVIEKLSNDLFNYLVKFITLHKNTYKYQYIHTIYRTYLNYFVNIINNDMCYRLFYKGIKLVYQKIMELYSCIDYYSYPELKDSKIMHLKIGNFFEKYSMYKEATEYFHIIDHDDYELYDKLIYYRLKYDENNTIYHKIKHFLFS
jgi:hypothetical protein